MGQSSGHDYCGRTSASSVQRPDTGRAGRYQINAVAPSGIKARRGASDNHYGGADEPATRDDASVLSGREGAH